jgi:c-di-GMP-binding flagellar brake protein YcgR
MAGTEQRKFQRIEIRIEVRVMTAETELVSEQLRDISLGGAFILTDTPPPVGSICEVNFTIDGPSSLLNIRVDGEIIRSDEDGMAVRFTKVDLDSLLYLRHLIGLHSGEPTKIDEEFSVNLLGVENQA